MSTKRITPEQVLSAYKATGYQPERSHVADIDGTCCAIGALAFTFGWNGRNSLEAYRIVEREGYDHYYITAFFRAFDDSEGSPGEGSSEGTRDGYACAAAVFGETK